MNRAALAGRLRSSESPALWLMAATVCRGARRVSRHRARWSSRLGYALERLDGAREAAAGWSWAAGTCAAGERAVAERDGFFGQFHLELKRPTVATFPRHGHLEVRTPEGASLRGPGGTDRLRITVPHGTGQR